MTPERWRQIGELFEAVARIDPAGREARLRAASGGDDELRAEVVRLLAQDERADRDGFLPPPRATGPPSERTPTGSWSPRVGGCPPQEPGPITRDYDAAGGFTPRAAIAPQTARPSIYEPGAVVRSRLRELPMIYILILGTSIFWRRAVLGQEDLTLYHVDAVVIMVLVGIIALLWSRCPVPLGWLKALELGMIGMLAGRFAFVQYWMMLGFSLRGDVMMAQLTLKNVVLLTSVLTLTYGLYVPKSWRRAALVVVPLAMMPFATLGALALRHPDVMKWLWLGWIYSTTPRVVLFTFDALILLILAVGSTFGAHTISRLRRQVAEARQLGQYRLLQRIGSGGMGEVYLAEHQLLKRPCAVKLIRPGAATDPRALDRFEREVRLTATLSHPNTVDVYDYGRAEDGTYYYVMEYLPGLSLAELVERHGPLPPGRVVYLLGQVCGALREAHAAGLIHRDIKPSNIFASRRGGIDDVAKLLDFGLVRPTADREAALSGEGQILGTPQFMSPEQAAGGRELDERSDIYSIGAVAYYLLTGRPPFEGRSGIAVLIAHARDPVVPPSQVRPGVPEDLERVVLRCLAKDATGRFADAESLERALGECACAGDWDQHRAALWWREADRAPATHAAVS
ncbi:MAG: serine/threonine-protein kinase [Paludisphaera borealis]|uniref:serine/threonine-protein kinase n=1 Tax=Paludisphaera borealis TaxID=1387353 RepID=UPI00283DF6AE|nr:serine/threonine-protein kinase [Paludisphaera borealis]MDR3622003.1 serine/threonine-protein kinase [Paludisphaera borealis]